MCLMVYMATDSPARIIERNAENQPFSVHEIDSNDESDIRSHFTKPHVYMLHAHEGCGCGFCYDPEEPFDDNDDDLRKCMESVRKLSEYVSEMLTQQDSIELYACWGGNEADPTEAREIIFPSQIGGESFEFEEGTFLLVVPDGTCVEPEVLERRKIS